MKNSLISNIISFSLFSMIWFFSLRLDDFKLTIIIIALIMILLSIIQHFWLKEIPVQIKRFNTDYFIKEKIKEYENFLKMAWKYFINLFFITIILIIIEKLWATSLIVKLWTFLEVSLDHKLGKIIETLKVISLVINSCILSFILYIEKVINFYKETRSNNIKEKNEFIIIKIIKNIFIK